MDSLKLLGYNFGRRISPGEHVKSLRQKYGARSWTIRHLKQAHIKPPTLVRVYCSLIRPAIEYPVSAYHSLLTQEDSEALERLQRMALKNIYGIKVPYQKCLELSGLQRLDGRRSEQLLAFAQRAQENSRFSHWFTRKEASVYGLRKEKKFVEEFASRDRLKNAPLFRMRQLLNDNA